MTERSAQIFLFNHPADVQLSCNTAGLLFMRHNLMAAASGLGHAQLHLQAPINTSERKAVQINWSAFYETITQLCQRRCWCQLRPWLWKTLPTVSFKLAATLLLCSRCKQIPPRSHPSPQIKAKKRLAPTRVLLQHPWGASLSHCIAAEAFFALRRKIGGKYLLLM